MDKATALPEPMIVRLGKGPVSLPRNCCCCGAAPDHEEVIERKKVIPLGIARITRTVTLAVTCCATCSRNVRWHVGMDRFVNRTIVLGILMLFLGLVAGAVVGGIAGAAGLGDIASQVLMWMVAVGIVTLWLIRRIRKAAAKPIEGHICSTNDPVEITNFDADTTMLAFRNLDYGKKVAAMNEPASVVAARPA